MKIIDTIASTEDTNILFDIVEKYLKSIGESEQAHGETWEETSLRLGNDEVLDAASVRWFELGC